MIARTVVRNTALVATALSWAFAVSGAAKAEFVDLVADRDATLFEDVTGSLASGSGATLFVGDNRTLVTRRALLHFDLAAALPEAATIVSAELWVYVTDAPDEMAREVSLHLVSADWGEGASTSGGGSGAPAELGDATWLHRFHPDEFWATAGGDFELQALATATLGISGWQVWTGEELVSSLQSWIDDPAANRGVLLRGEEGTASSARGIASREHVDPGLRPYLRIEYSSCCVAVERASWSELKGRFDD